MSLSVRILSLAEINHVATSLHRLKRRSPNAHVNLVLFRLATCCGLRVAELTGLSMANVKLASARPHIYVPATIAKGSKARTVPLWWDAATLADLSAWKEKRIADGASGADALLSANGRQLKIRAAQLRWDTVIRKTLGAERAETLSIHCGRHTFCSQSLMGGKTLAQVRDAAGHGNVSTTNIYLHVAADESEVGNVFAVARMTSFLGNHTRSIAPNDRQ